MVQENRNVSYRCAGFSSVVQRYLDDAHSDVKATVAKASQNTLPVSSMLATLVQRYTVTAESAFAAGGASLRVEAAEFFEQRGFDPKHDRETLDTASQEWQHSTESVRVDLSDMAQKFPRMRRTIQAWTVAGIAIGAVFGVALEIALRLTVASAVPGVPEQATQVFEKIERDALHNPQAFILSAGLIVAVAFLGGCIGKRCGGARRGKQICTEISSFMAKADNIILNEWQKAEAGFAEIIGQTNALEKEM